MANIPFKSSEIKEIFKEHSLYITAFGQMNAEYDGMIQDLYRRAVNSEEVVISSYENQILMKIIYLLNMRNY